MTTIRSPRSSSPVRTTLLVISAGAALVSIGRGYGLNAGEWASWVQAVGSIAAILIAYFLGERQAQAAVDTMREAEQLSSARTYDQIVALAESVEKFTESMSTIFHDGGFDYLVLRHKYDEAITESLLDSLKAVSAHELGSYNAILALTTLRKALQDFRDNMARIEQHLQSQRNLETGAIANWHNWSPVPIELCVTNVKRCVAGLKQHRPEFAKRPRDS
ncbi:hypothetical protein [Massilia haematophila]|uniref:Uncharacterized protein n=1 Tax=Massilia haematophila TaxID=457923 RepID=A0ABV7PDI7_9BURK